MVKKRFTFSELKKFDGSDGRPAYVGLKGKIYDVSDSPFWKNGKHLGAHTAGNDLTLHIPNMPHSEDVLNRSKFVGVLISEGYTRQKFIRMLQSLHLHSILVHFSLAYSITVPLFSFLYAWTGVASIEIASYYLLLLGLIAGLFATGSGIFSWKVTYEGRINKIFSRKILLSIVLMILTLVSLVFRILNPNILIEGSSLSYLYLSLTLTLVPISVILGHYGGKIVYP